MPIIAAVGSFVVSERIVSVARRLASLPRLPRVARRRRAGIAHASHVRGRPRHLQLKPKVTALVVLSCLAGYDVLVAPPEPPPPPVRVSAAQHEQQELDEFWDFDDPPRVRGAEEDDLATSLRCYRGPAMLAVSLFCVAWCLRIWRRNGVACDELLFLPGTPHEFRCVGSTADEVAAEARGKNDASHAVEMTPFVEHGFPGSANGAAGSTLQPPRAAAGHQSHEALNSESSDGSPAASTADDERRSLMDETPPVSSLPIHKAPSSDLRRKDSFIFIRDQALKGIDMLVVRKSQRPPPMPDKDAAADSEYAPSAPSVLGAGLDLSIPVLFNFHMFVFLMKSYYRKEARDEAGHDRQFAADVKMEIKDSAWMTPPQVPPMVLPLFSITPLILRSMVPRRQRRRFYRTVLRGTVLSPFRPVTFRDAFVADCLTSMVRTVGDIVYTLAYYVTAVFGLCSGKYDLNRAGAMLETSVAWHGLILPALSVLPLCIKFLQALRQAYDAGRRWPHLGDALKYASAGLVILHGMTHAALERSTWWVLSFVVATAYQIAWDTLVDWELLVFVPSEPFRNKQASATNNALAKLCRAGRDALPRCGQIRLRPKRLFDDDSYYWKALFVNAILRPCWMAGFIPAYRVSIADRLKQVTFVDKAHGWSFVLMAMLEIFRRSIWAIIKVELETIRLKDQPNNTLNSEGQNTDMAPTANESLREGSWKTPPDGKGDFSACLSVVRNTWRSRLKKTNPPTAAAANATKTVRTTTLVTEGDAREARLDSKQIQYSKLEQLEPTDPSRNAQEKQTHQCLCLSIRRGFLQLLFVAELLLWIVAFLLAGYYVIL